MAAREEAAKWIAVHCWDFLDDKIRNQIFRHEFKHKAAGVFYFLSGELHAIDFAIGAFQLIQERSPELGISVQQAIQYFPKAHSADNPKKLADVITRALTSYENADDSPEITKKKRIATERAVDEAETMRQKSIYVDFDSVFEITGDPNTFGPDEYERIKKDVIVAKYYIEKLSGLEPNKDILYQEYPEWKQEIEENLKKLASELRSLPSK